MHVGQHRHAKTVADLGQDRQPVGHADAARRRGAGAVGLVETTFVDQPDAGGGADLLQRGRHLQRMAAAFDLAWAGDQHEWQVVADFQLPDADGFHHQTSRDWRIAAAMKPENSGCGSNGFDFSSG